MLLNLGAIGAVMIPSFARQVAPNVRHAARDAYYGVALGHAALGTAAEVLGLYVAAVALGWRIVPARLRFHAYRRWMQATLILWWIVIALGVGTYLVWYGAGSAAAPAAPTAAEAPASASVVVHNFAFEPAALTIKAGTTVTWRDELGRHTVETTDGLLNSGTLVAGGTYQKRFDTPGTYEYFCGNHGNKNGTGMTGKIVVTR
jgi:plastocyanin